MSGATARLAQRVARYVAIILFIGAGTRKKADSGCGSVGTNATATILKAGSQRCTTVAGPTEATDSCLGKAARFLGNALQAYIVDIRIEAVSDSQTRSDEDAQETGDEEVNGKHLPHL